MKNVNTLNAKSQTRAQFEAINKAKYDAALAKAEGKAVATIVVKPPRAAMVVISPWHVKLYAASFAAAGAVNKAIESQRVVMRTMLQAQYGDTAPTFEQFRADRDALRVMALDRGLVDDQWIRKPYNAALIELYKTLPVSMSPAAVLKRAQRPVVEKAKPGAKKNVTKPAQESPVDTVGQFIAKFGAAAVLAELAKILATAKATSLDAQVLSGIAKHYK